MEKNCTLVSHVSCPKGVFGAVFSMFGLFMGSRSAQQEAYCRARNLRVDKGHRTWWLTVISCLLAMCLSQSVNGQLTGTLNVPGSYATLALAIADLNTQGVGGGGVTINLVAGNPQTAPAGGFVIGDAGSMVLSTSSMANPVVIQGNGNTITAFAPQTAGALNDAIFKIIGADWITITGFTLNENPANLVTTAASNDMTEWGVALLYVTTTDGAQNNTIQNCVIDLNRTYQNTFGIYSNSTHSPTVVSTSATATTTNGGNSGLKIYSNTVTDVNNGIVVVGPTAAVDHNDVLEVGGSVSTGNAITDYGTTGTFSTFANVSGTVNGILVRNTKNFTISNNSVTSSNGGTTSGTLNGIQIPAFSNTPTGTFTNSINDNSISVQSGAASGAINGINHLGTSASVTSTININNNDFHTSGHTVAGTGTIVFLNQVGAHLNVNIMDNTFSNLSVNTTGSVTFISNNVTKPANAISNVNGNSIVTAFSKTGAGGTITFYNSNSFTPTSGTETNSGNDFSNITATGATTIAGWVSTDGSTTSPFGPTKIVTDNIFTNITGGTSAVTVLAVSYANAGSSGNDVSGNVISNVTGGGAVTGLTTVAGRQNFFANTINALSSTGAAVVSGFSSTGGTSASQEFYGNKIYDLSSSNAGGTVNGVLISGSSSGQTINLYNNLIGDLRAPAATGTSAVVRGINMTATGSTSTYQISFNSVFLNATSSGAEFSTAGIFHTTSATATTASLILRNNLIVNLSTPTGAGITAAYRRSSTTLTNYGSDSNNNLYYAGTPGPANLIFYDGTNSDETLGSYIARVMPRDILSITENPPFLSTSGASADFLHINTITPTFIEGGGNPIAGITEDYDGNVRDLSTPDIGADEFAGTEPACVGTPPVSNTIVSPAGPYCNGQILTLSLDQSYFAVNYQWQSSSDNMTWMDIDGATFSTLMTSTSTTTYYRAVVDCPASGMSTNSVSAIVTIPVNLNGTYTINNSMATGGTNYNNFVDAVNDLNCRGVSGPVVFNVTAGQTFASSVELNITTSGSMTNTIQFVRSGAGANPVVQRLGTSGTTDYILRIGGGDYFTFDGINFEQTGTSATDWVEFGIYLQNASVTDGASNNTFRNLTVAMTNQSALSKGVYVHSPFTPTATSGTNSNNRFLNMTVTDSWEGYRITGATTTFPDDGNEISTESEGTSVIQNLGDGTATGSMYGVLSTYQTHFKVKNTEIANLMPGGTSLVYGIALQTSTANSAEFSGNEIHDITGGGTVNGIQITSVDTADIFNNRIYALSTTTATSLAVRGIDVGGTGANVNVYNNQIYNISSAGLTTTTAGGIDIGTGLVYNVYNNMISDIRAPSSTTTSGGTRGITVSSGSTGGVVKIYHNTILLTDVGAVAGYTSAALHNSSTTPSLDIRNNIVINKSDVTTGTRAVAFWKTSATDNVDNASNTNLYYAGTPGAKNLIYYDGTTSAQTIADYRALPAIAPGEAYSVTEDVVFAAIVNGILRPNSATPTLAESSGLLVAGYSSDFETNARGPYPVGGQSNGGGFGPDLGADEGDFTYITPSVPDCPTLGEPADGEMDLCFYQGLTLTWTPAITGGFATGGYDVYFGTSMIPPLVANTFSTSYTPVGLSADETYYWSIVPKNGSGSAVGCTPRSFTTVDAEITSTTPGGSCSPASVMLGATGTGTLNWYAAPTGGTALGTGNVFNTPVITETTDYYVAAGVGFASDDVGASVPGSTGTYTLEAGLLFDVFESFTLEGVYIYPIGTGAGTVEIALEISGSTVESLSFPCTGTASPGVATYVPLNWIISPGTQYLLNMTSRTGLVTSLIRDLSGDIVGGPIASNPDMTVPGIVTITSGQLSGSGTSPTYYFFYDWAISTGCESNRVPVTAAIHDGVVVNNTNSDPGSLRANILCAAPNDVITFDASLLNQSIDLTSVIVIDKNLTISGLGMSNLTISGGSVANIFHVMPGVTLTIEDIALKDGFAMTNGGAIYNQGSLSLENVLFENNLPYVLSGAGSVDISGTVNVTD